MHLRPNAAIVLALPLLLAAAPLPTELGFQPPEGHKVTRDYGIEFDFEIGDLTVIADGQDMSEMIGSADMSGNGALKLQTQDHFVRAGGGRALELIRTYASIEAEMEAGGESQEMDGADDLEGKSVKFVWNEESGEYDVAYHESEGEEESLESVGADMDLTALLPDRDVAAGDVWSVPASEIGSVLLFGANMQGDIDDPQAAALLAEIQPQLDKLLETFKISCEYKGERDEGGAKVGVIGVDLAGEGELDLEPVIRAIMDQQELPVEIDISFDSASLGLSLTGKGELFWNVQNGTLHAFDLGADVELAIDVDVAMDAEGQSHEMQAEVEVLGRGTWKVRTGAGE